MARRLPGPVLSSAQQRAKQIAWARERDRELRATWPREHHGRIVLEISEELGLMPSTIYGYLRTDREPLIRRTYAGHWTEQRLLRAVRAWIEMYGQAPNTVDWTPSELKRRIRQSGRPECPSRHRLERFEAGWTDEDGSWSGWPSARQIGGSAALEKLILEVNSESQ